MSLTLRSANLALAFVLELCLLAAVGYWGFHVQASTALQIVLGIGAPLLVAVFWGILLSPRAPVQIKDPLHLLLVTAVFAAGVVALIAAGRPDWAWTFAIVFVINRVLLYIWPQ